MEKQLKLYMVMLGCTPKGRLTEQHDIFFGIGTSVKDLVPEMKAFWPEAKGKIHIDAWREITAVDNHLIQVIDKTEKQPENENTLFFINLGGYKKGEFEEYHYKMVTVSKTLGAATRKVKSTTFFKHCGFEGAGASHIDDKYGIDVDETHRVNDILDSQYKDQYGLKITKSNQPLEEDELHIGYVKIKTISV
ncbi:DUF1543 domain-containing protein [Flavobacterium sp. F-380]|uniref:DUF1543 domain-containing protein n=1 Tax=Flavobacterium kayseriense TaxID=2764714 RepID=A0ABR7J6S9_9FLAO|nr:DUF1543 domain-containing protein [Flavobacterium kayseriense]MBC5841157.1 DUF1543 domain-containing protein [Flavobacterium kayseriense]MBC5847685.1 DUF1543 domain-containing protein [Flavobacterium kayseriense]MBU0939895.1 DUF1543 domain-containing protein [Bacteroidota bacterium]